MAVKLELTADLFVEAIGVAGAYGVQITAFIVRKAPHQKRRIFYSIEGEMPDDKTCWEIEVGDDIDAPKLCMEGPAKIVPTDRWSWMTYNLPGDQVGARLMREPFPDCVVEITPQAKR